MALPIEVLADLQLAVDGENVDIQASGSRIVVDLPSLRAGRRILDAYPLSGARRSRTTNQFHEALDVAGLTLDVRLRGQSIVRAGAGVEPGRLGRLLNLGAVEVRPTPALRTAVRRRPVVTVLVIAGLLTLIGWGVSRLVRS